MKELFSSAILILILVTPIIRIQFFGNIWNLSIKRLSWDTNFKASQGEDTLLRYRLTSTSQYNPVESSGFAIEQTVPPVIVRVPHAEIDTKGTFMNISPKRGCEVHLKKAMDRQGLIIHAYKLGESIQTLYASFPSIQIAEAYSCSPTEDDLEAIDVVNNTVSFDVPSRSVAFVRVVVNPISLIARDVNFPSPLIRSHDF